MPYMHPYPVSTRPWLNSWPTLPSLSWHPPASPLDDIQYSIYPLHCWGPCCYFSSLSGLTRPPHQDAWQMVQQCISDLYSQSRQYYCGGSKPSHLTGIFCVSFSFLSCFCRVPRDFGSLEPRLPPALNPSFSLRSGLHQLRESLRLGMEAHAWLDCGDLPAMGAVFYLGAGWPQ